MWLYDEPYGPYVPRSIFRKRPEPAAPPPEPATPATPADSATAPQGDTVESLREHLKFFINTILEVLQPYKDAYQAVLECCRHHATHISPPPELAT